MVFETTSWPNDYFQTRVISLLTRERFFWNTLYMSPMSPWSQWHDVSVCNYPGYQAAVAQRPGGGWILLFPICEKIHCYVSNWPETQNQANNYSPAIKWDPLELTFHLLIAKSHRVSSKDSIIGVRKGFASPHVRLGEAENSSWSQFWRPRSNNVWEPCGWFLDRKKLEKWIQ